MASSRPLPKILHIYATTGTSDRNAASPVRSSLGEAMAAVLAERFETETRRDVYVALARILKTMPPAAGPAPVAVLVCIDHMEAAELEFFSLVARHRPEFPTLVYGRSDLEALISQAIDRGATGRATAEGLQALADRAGSPAIGRDTEAAADVHVDASPSPERSPSQNDTEDWPKPDVAAEDEPVQPVRVPWLRYADAPARGAPEPRTTDDDSESPASQPFPGDAMAVPQHTPLLTDEELQALMGPSDFDDANSDGANGTDAGLEEDRPGDDRERDDRMELGQ